MEGILGASDRCVAWHLESAGQEEKSDESMLCAIRCGKERDLLVVDLRPRSASSHVDMPQKSTDVLRCRQSRFVGILMEFNGILNGIQVTRTAAYANKVGGGGFERAWPLLTLRDLS